MLTASTAARQNSDSHIRPVEARDVSRIADMQEKLLGRGNPAASSSLRDALMTIIMDNPWRTQSMPSLVYEESDGSLSGFLGVVPRPMIFEGRKILASISHTFVVEPDSRSSLVALKLIKAYMSGPQDLSIAEGNDISRRIWEGLGGAIPLLYSLGWMRVLQPAQYALGALKRRNLPSAVITGLKYFGRQFDSVLTRKGPFRLAEPRLSGEMLKTSVVCDHLQKFCQRQALRPQYDEQSLDWLLNALGRKARCIRKILLRNESGEIVGWYIYALTATGAWKVIQLMAAQDSEGDVLDHLFYQASRDGAVAIYGFMESRFFPALSARDCIFRHDGKSPWMLVYSRNPRIVQSFNEGKAVVSRLDGEWWVSFLIE